MSKSKPQLVLLHGLFGSPLGLEGITKELRDAGYEVFVPAVPPFAGSEADWVKLETKSEKSEPTSDIRKRYADYFRDYFAKNKIKNPVLIGHSMGTIVTSSIVMHYPELINDKIILMSPISSQPNALISKVSLLSAYLPPKLVDWITTQFLVSKLGRKSFREILNMVHQCTFDRRPARKYIKEAVKFSTSFTITENLQQTSAQDKHFQLCLLPGEHDHLVSQDATQKAAKTLNNLPNQLFRCECIFLLDTGHLHNYEKPHETVEQIIEFLES